MQNKATRTKTTVTGVSETKATQPGLQTGLVTTEAVVCLRTTAEQRGSRPLLGGRGAPGAAARPAAARAGPHATIPLAPPTSLISMIATQVPLGKGSFEARRIFLQMGSLLGMYPQVTGVFPHLRRRGRTPGGLATGGCVVVEGRTAAMEAG